MKNRLPLSISLATGAFLALTLGGAGAQQTSGDLGKGALAQCWTSTVKVMTLMEAGLVNPPLSGKQQQGLYAAIEARDAENYGECVEKMQEIPAEFR
jgi:hypothetical protein